MWVRIEVYNCFDDHLGDLPNDIVIIREYEIAPLSFILYSDKPAETFRLEVAGESLLRKGNIFDFRSEKGRRGDIKIRIYHKNEYLNTGFLRVTGQRLNEKQFRYLIQDIKSYLISIASADKTTVKGKYNEIEFQFIDAYDWRLNKIKVFLKNIKHNLAAIEQSPQPKIIKHYHVVLKDKARKIDARTIRWRAINGARKSTHALTYTNIESFDVYENQFIVYILKRIQRYLGSLNNSFAHAVEQKVEQLKHRQNDLNGYDEIEGDGKEQRKNFKTKQIDKISRVIEKMEKVKQKKLPDYSSKCDRLRPQIDQLLRSPLLKGIQYRTSLIIEPTLVLIRNPAYYAIYDGYKYFEKILQFNEQQQIEALLERVPIERTSKLYEYWVFIQVYEELKRMGFKDVDGSKGILGMLDKNTFRLKEDTHLELIGDSNLYKYKDKTVKVSIYYNHSLGPNNNFLRPDIFIEFIGKIEFIENEKKILILDAKYRDYDAQGYSQYKEEDVNDTANNKYLKLQRKNNDDGSWIEIEGVEEIREQIAASFIIHSHYDEKRFIDYGSAGNANKYGAIPLVPNERGFNSTNMKMLLKMFMRMHLHLFNICWSETGVHEQPVKANRGKKLGGRNREECEWEYHCPECDNRWWVNHCGHWCKGKDRNGKSINVTKITFSDPSDNFFDVDKDKKLLKCSNCNEYFWVNKYKTLNL